MCLGGVLVLLLLLPLIGTCTCALRIARGRVCEQQAGWSSEYERVRACRFATAARSRATVEMQTDAQREAIRSAMAAEVEGFEGAFLNGGSGSGSGEAGDGDAAGG